MKPTIMKSSFHKLPNSTPPPAPCLPHNHMLSSGFTLVEVLVVVVIIGLLASIAFPMYSKWIPAYRAKGAAQLLYADLQKAKSHAIKTNRKVTFNFTVSPTCSGTTGYTFTDSGGTVVVNETGNNGICFSSSTFTNGTDGFDSRGLSLQTGLPLGRSVKLKHISRAREYEISQSFAGSVTIK